MVLVVNGRIQEDNLATTGKDQKWLEGVLKSRGIKIQEAALCFIDTSGKMTLQLKNAKPMFFKAMDESGVKW